MSTVVAVASVDSSGLATDSGVPDTGLASIIGDAAGLDPTTVVSATGEAISGLATSDGALDAGDPVTGLASTTIGEALSGDPTSGLAPTTTGETLRVILKLESLPEMRLQETQFPDSHLPQGLPRGDPGAGDPSDGLAAGRPDTRAGDFHGARNCRTCLRRNGYR